MAVATDWMAIEGSVLTRGWYGLRSQVHTAVIKAHAIGPDRSYRQYSFKGVWKGILGHYFQSWSWDPVLGAFILAAKVGQAEH